MTQYDNTNRGALFKNEDKTKDSQPDYRGPINVQGVDLELAAWLKDSKSGKKYMQLKIGPKWEPKQQKQKDYIASAQGVSEPDDPNDPIPF